MTKVLLGGRVCSGCHQLLDHTSFYPNHTQCIDCDKRVATQYMKDHPAYARIAYHAKKGDPIEFSRNVCEYVGEYVTNKINQFEQRHGIEAPPHLTALVSVARSVTAEHPPRKHKVGTYPRTQSCTRCGSRYTAKRSSTLCPDCRPIVAAEARRAWKRSEAGKASKRRYEQTDAGKASRRRQADARSSTRRPPHPCLTCPTEIPGNRKYCEPCSRQRQREATKAWKLNNPEATRRHQAKYHANKASFSP